MMLNSVMNSSVNFGARFQKKPVDVTAVQQDEPFSVKNPWGEGMLDGDKGAWLIFNHLSGETYPCKEDSFAHQYIKVKGNNRYQTRVDKPVYLEAELPTTEYVETHEGRARTVGTDGKPAMVGKGEKDSKPYPIPGDYFIKAYAPVDKEASDILDQLRIKLADYNAKRA